MLAFAHVAVNPIVSVLMPVKNGEQFLSQALASIHAQTLSDWELVIVLDNCTDSSRAIVDRYSDRRFHVIDHRGVGGVANVLNRGLEACRAAIVARMDCDDICLPERLEVQTITLANRPELLALGSSAQVIDKDSQVIGKRSVQTGDAVSRSLLWRNQLIHPATIFRKQAIIAKGGYDPDFSITQDYELWLRVVEVGNLDNIAEPLIQYRLHTGQDTHALTLGRCSIGALHRRRREAAARLGLACALPFIQSGVWIGAQLGRDLRWGTRRALANIIPGPR